MAKVTISVDTETKIMSVSIDGGETIDGLDYLCASRYENYDGETELELRFSKSEKVDKVRKVTHYCVANNKLVEGEPTQKAIADIAEFYKNKRG